jgi:hypothetical protein
LEQDVGAVGAVECDLVFRRWIEAGGDCCVRLGVDLYERR